MKHIAGNREKRLANGYRGEVFDSDGKLVAYVYGETLKKMRVRKNRIVDALNVDAIALSARTPQKGK